MARLRSNSGFTLIEVMVAMLIGVLVIGAAAAAFASGNAASVANQRQSALVTVAQREIEKIRAEITPTTYSELALSAYPPTPTTSIGDPDYWVQHDGTASATYDIEENWDSASSTTAPGTPSGGESLYVDTVNGIIPPVTYSDLTTGQDGYSSATSIPAGDDYATVYSYVTEATVPCNSTVGTCAASDVRRLIVAVVLHQVGTRQNVGPTAPFYVDTIIGNPIPSNQPQSVTGLSLGLSIGNL
jgi:prepilin-type N-terminal cleavage/methylation domain-containing protein